MAAASMTGSRPSARPSPSPVTPDTDLYPMDLIDPASRKRVEPVDGAEGEAVYTSLSRKALPVLRFGSGDLGHLHPVHAAAIDFEPRKPRLDLFQILGRKSDTDRAVVLPKMLQISGAGDRHDPRLLRHQPGKRDWAGVAFLSAPKARRYSMIGWLFSMAMREKRGNVARRSFAGSIEAWTFASIVPGKKPCPSGPHGTKPMPSSSQVSSTSASGAR